jgi:2-hydroxychromene-2-carboxylate isomerase
MWRDLLRWATRLGVPFTMPANFPVSSVLALRTALAVEKQGKLVPFTHAMYRAYWVEGQDLSQPDVVANAASAVGLDGPAMVAAAPEHKAALAAQTQDAIDRGTFGAPTFFVAGELFVGNDRLDFVEEALCRL